MRNNDFAISRGRFISSSGSAEKPVFSPKLQEDGTIKLEITGVFNTDDEINLYGETCSLENMIARFLDGDLDAVNRVEPVYLDTTEFPKTYAEALQHFINCENYFNSLRVDIRNKYGNNWRNWILQAGTDEWLKDFGFKVDESGSVVKDIVEEGVSDES